MEKYFGGLNFAGFRRMFYLATPHESSFPSLESTPNIVNEAIPWFLILIILEIAYSLYKGKRNYYRINDAVTSFSSGLLQLTIKVLFRSIEFTVCCYIHEKFSFIDLPWNSTWTWIIAFLAVDFAYYWSHRAVHEVNFLWAFHQMHHSSEDYNLSTALRQHMIIQYTSIFFNAPQAILLPPQVHLVHTSLNLIYQFWIHTQVITNLGPLEYLINTPSHHRVHHGRNRYCIDKNYAGTLIIWDRIFGTFQAEKQEEPVVYGLVHNVNTFNQLYCQLYLFKHVFWDKLKEMNNVMDKIKAIFYGPGWLPNKPRLGILEEIPEIENPVQIYDPVIPIWQNIYVCYHVLLTFAAFFVFAGQREDSSFFAALPHVIMITLSFNCYGAFFDAKWYAPLMEITRCILYVYLNLVQIWIFQTSMILSAIFWILYIIKPVTIKVSKT